MIFYVSDPLLFAQDSDKCETFRVPNTSIKLTGPLSSHSLWQGSKFFSHPEYFTYGTFEVTTTTSEPIT